jgi:hypothetical protein
LLDDELDAMAADASRPYRIAALTSRNFPRRLCFGCHEGCDYPLPAARDGRAAQSHRDDGDRRITPAH